jgi:apolipoprotein N-acyltransferase
VWNEIATVIQPAEEPAFTARATTLAVELGVDLVLAYAVLEQSDPVLFDNKYLFISDTGEVLDEYQKHHPVPGEPSIRGTAPLKMLKRPYGVVGGAICYDYDFPSLAREHARSAVDIVVLPSSDWRGIDPIHTYMARTRAIEGGFALVRAVRWAPSGVFDALGTPRGWMTAIDDNDGVLLAQVPVGQRQTLATKLGYAPVWVALVTLLTLMSAALRANDARKGPRRGLARHQVSAT